MYWGSIFRGLKENSLDRTIMLYIYSTAIQYESIVKQLYQKLSCDKILRTVKVQDKGDLYIMFGLHEYVDHLPKNYIAIQLEQSTWTVSYFTQGYIDKLKGALQVWEYSLVNYKFLCNKGISSNTLYYCPIFSNGITNTTDTKDIKDIDLFFIGAMNKRRTTIIDTLKAS